MLTTAITASRTDVQGLVGRSEVHQKPRDVDSAPTIWREIKVAGTIASLLGAVVVLLARMG
ncbi:MAG TPA: hypothetical protein VGZ22_12145 [Isosphaeraceae bacterium]|jgi:hypothetical protein|nr:hypothetical protein [Isosphaeraceae bacterium]